jgi:sulfur relay (sulfurtransferase) complex TusBCD TusD component (DsrE family)
MNFTRTCLLPLCMIARRFRKQNAIYARGHEQVKLKLFLFEKSVTVTEKNTVPTHLRRILGAPEQHWKKRVRDIGND